MTPGQGVPPAPCMGSDPALFLQGLPGQPGSKGGPGDKVGAGLNPQPWPLQTPIHTASLWDTGTCS